MAISKPFTSLKKRLKQTLKKISLADIFGQTFKLEFEKQRTHKTVFGSILSLIIAVFSILLFINFIKTQYDTKNPFINSAIIIEESPSKRNLYDSKFTMAVGAFLDNGERIPPENLSKYGTPIILVQELNLAQIESGILTFDTKHLWLFKPCKDLTDTTLTKDLLDPSKTSTLIANFVRKNMLCPDITHPEDMHVKSNVVSPPYRQLD